jgi:DNA-binding GntR family transcriptional regulator
MESRLAAKGSSMKYLNISESTLQYLRQQIISGKIAGGERLNENRLSTELGVSRPPLREAFRILENERLVETTPRIGTFVTELSNEDFRQICEIRSMVESFAIGQLKARGLTVLPALQKALEVNHAIPVPEKFADDEQKYDLFCRFARFHLQLVESAGNSYLTHWYRGLSSNIGRYQYLFLFQPGIIAKDLNDHVKLLALIKANQFDEAEQFLKAHLEFQRQKMMTTLSAIEKP